MKRFWDKVDRSAGLDKCWPWLGSKPDGYGRFGISSRKDGTRKTVRAHRFALELRLGRELRPGMWAAVGLTQKLIAERFGVSQTHVSRLVRGVQWKKEAS